MLATLLMTYVVKIPGRDQLQSSRGVIAVSYLALIPLTLSYRRLIYRLATNAEGGRSLVFLGDWASCHAFRSECEKVGATQRIVYSVVSRRLEPTPFVGTNDDRLRPFIRRSSTKSKAASWSSRPSSCASPTASWSRTSRRSSCSCISRACRPTRSSCFTKFTGGKFPFTGLNLDVALPGGLSNCAGAGVRAPETRQRHRPPASRRPDPRLASDLRSAPSPYGWRIAGRACFAQTRIGKSHVPFHASTSSAPCGSPPRRARVIPSPVMPGSRPSAVSCRVSRLDELPQIWNVLRGDMSLIGPRAEWDKLVADYEREIPCYYFRHLVRPGITGWAQVNYPYGANLEDTVRKLEYDLYYIRHFSFTLDASIVLKTIHVMLFGKGR